jgi:hypothetical protein
MLAPLLLLTAAAFAQAPPPEEREGAPAAEEMIVFGDMEERQRRMELEQTLQDMGYRPGKSRDNGRTVFRPQIAWHPTVIIDDDGFAIIRRSPVRFEPWVGGNSNLRWISCVPPFTVMCVKLGGWLVSDRKLTHKKTFLVEGMDPSLDAWREVLVANAMGRRLNEEIPDMLEGIWTHGIMPLGEPLQTPEERRLAIVTFWASRACTPEGAAARQTAADFLQYVVQDSAHPVTAEERAAAEAANRCGDPLVLE